MDIVIWRNEKYNNSECVRKLPYEGKSYFVAKYVDEKRIKEFYSYYISKSDFSHFVFTKTTTEELKNAKALNFKAINDYVLGNSDVLPDLEVFNYKKHCAKLDKNLPIKMGIQSVQSCRYYGFPPYIPMTIYQILI